MSAPYVIIALVMLVIVSSVVFLRQIHREYGARGRSDKTSGGDAPLLILSTDDGGSDGGGGGGSGD